MPRSWYVTRRETAGESQFPASHPRETQRDSNSVLPHRTHTPSRGVVNLAGLRSRPFLSQHHPSLTVDRQQHRDVSGDIDPVERFDAWLASGHSYGFHFDERELGARVFVAACLASLGVTIFLFWLLISTLFI